MTTILSILAFAALFAAFAALAPVLRRGSCGGDGDGCASCAGDRCPLSESKHGPT